MRREIDGDAAAWDRHWANTRADKDRTNDPVYQRYCADLLACWQRQPSGAQTVELGAGRGTISLMLHRWGADVRMCDASTHARELSRKLWSSRELLTPVEFSLRYDLCCATRARWHGWADLCFSIGVVEHFRDPLPLLEASLNQLKPGGFAWHVVITKISSNQAFYRNDFRRADYRDWEWETWDGPERHIFYIGRKREADRNSSR